MKRLSMLLKERLEVCARMISLEMGKPIREARAEVGKCGGVCDYYADHAQRMLLEERIESDASLSLVRNDPIGTVLGIMPWNFPFWQVFRFSVPALMAGNTVLLKHAPNVFGCAVVIEELFREAGFPEGVFRSLILHHEKSERLIAHDSVRAVAFTGSERAGSSVAMLAGKHLKKTVLELGGSNAFVVLEDADLDEAVRTGVKARMSNSGQSCVAAKRFIPVGEQFEPFLNAFINRVRQLKAGDPLLEETQVGPLARRDLAETLKRQMTESIGMGAELLLGGGVEGAFFEPAVLAEVEPGMPAFDQETFGPLASFVRASSEEEAYRLAAGTKYGLGLTVFTSDVDKALRKAGELPDGAYFVNELVSSDPRLPFGGTGRSGYGRELSRDGILEFVNRKTVYVK